MILVRPTQAVAEMWPDIARDMWDPNGDFREFCEMSGGLEGSFEQQDRPGESGMWERAGA